MLILTFIPTYSRCAVQWNPAFDNAVMMHTRLYSRLQTRAVMQHIDGLNVMANRQTGKRLQLINRYPNFICLQSLRYVKQVSKSLLSLYFLSAISQCPSLTYSKL